MTDRIAIQGTGRTVGRFGFGCAATGGHGWGADTGERAIQAIRYGYEQGIDFFDTSNIYGLGVSETRLAEALGDARHDVLIATKGGMRWDARQHRSIRDNSESHLRQSVEGSLKRLKLDCIPLYYIHWPDGQTPVRQVMQTLMKLRDEGKIQAIGLSNFEPEDVAAACKVGPVSAVQVRYNLLMRDHARRYLPICRRGGIAFVAWGGLNYGLLTGKFSHDTIIDKADHRSRDVHFNGALYQRNLAVVEQLKPIAQSLNMPLAGLALRSLVLLDPEVCVLFGAKTPEQAKENCRYLHHAIPDRVLAQIRTIIDLPSPEPHTG